MVSKSFLGQFSILAIYCSLFAYADQESSPVQVHVNVSSSHDGNGNQILARKPDSSFNVPSGNRHVHLSIAIGSQNGVGSVTTNDKSTAKINDQPSEASIKAITALDSNPTVAITMNQLLALKSFLNDEQFQSLKKQINLKNGLSKAEIEALEFAKLSQERASGEYLIPRMDPRATQVELEKFFEGFMAFDNQLGTYYLDKKSLSAPKIKSFLGTRATSGIVYRNKTDELQVRVCDIPIEKSVNISIIVTVKNFHPPILPSNRNTVQDRFNWLLSFIAGLKYSFVKITLKYKKLDGSKVKDIKTYSIINHGKRISHHSGRGKVNNQASYVTTKRPSYNGGFVNKVLTNEKARELVIALEVLRYRLENHGSDFNDADWRFLAQDLHKIVSDFAGRSLLGRVLGYNP